MRSKLTRTGPRRTRKGDIISGQKTRTKERKERMKKKIFAVLAEALGFVSSIRLVAYNHLQLQLQGFTPNAIV